MNASMRNRPSTGFLITAPLVLIIGVGLVISTLGPARARRAQISCESNLMMIDIARRQWAEASGEPADARVDTQAVHRLMGGDQVRVICPHGGQYSYGRVGTPPSCTCGRSLMTAGD
jgi:hypothetical protein